MPIEYSLIDIPVKDLICSTLKITKKLGLFNGGNPFVYPTALLLVQLSLAVFSNAILQHFLVPLGQTTFIPQILAGLILGPCLGKNMTFRRTIFPPASIYTGDTLAYFGVILFFFLVGVKMDMRVVRRPGRQAYYTGACTVLFPMSFNFFMVAVLKRSIPMESKMHESLLWVASFQSMCSSHVIITLLYDLKLLSSDLGRQALSSSIISGAISLLWSTSVFTGKESSTRGNPQWMMILMTLLIFGMLLFMVFVLNPLFSWMERNTVDSKSVKDGYILMIFILILGSAIYSEMLGQHFLYGPMFLGVIVPEGPPLGTAIVTKLETVVINVLLPVYFVVTCSMLDFSLIRARNFWIIFLLSFFAFIWKVIGAMLPCFWFKNCMEDALPMGLVMSIQGINDCLIIERAMQLGLIDKETFTIMILCVVIFSGTTSPLIKSLYKPSKKYTCPYNKRTIEGSDPKTELRLLGCIYHSEQTPLLLNFIETLYPNPKNPICFYVIDLIDLAGRGAPLLLDHHEYKKRVDNIGSERVLNVLRLFQQKHEGKVTVYPFTAIVPDATVHDDVCSLAMDKKVSMVIIPFHKFYDITETEEDKPRPIRRANQNILKYAPCSVGILVDRSYKMRAFMRKTTNLYRVGVVFIGGGDDREALSLGGRMAKHPYIRLSILHPIEYGVSRDNESKTDSQFIKRFLEANEESIKFSYEEEVMEDNISIVNMVRQMEKHMDLIIVGRRHERSSRMLLRLTDWNEYPELGYIGDLLATSDRSNVSVLVVQQQSFTNDDDDNIINRRINPSTVLDMHWSSSTAWPP